MISELIGHKSKIKTNNKRLRPSKSEVDRLLANNELAKKLIGWEPKLKGKVGLSKGLQTTINWFSEYQESNYTVSDYIY